jgi:tetratricopeptide (TPR) repeat protein
MRRGWEAALGFILVALASPLAPARAATDGAVEAALCSVASGRDANNNTLNCNFGLTPEQFKQLTDSVVKGAAEAAGKGATEAAVEAAKRTEQEQIDRIGKTLGVTEDAVKSLLKIVGEDPNVPEDKLAEALSKAAEDYKRLQAQVAALNPDNPTARALVEQAKPEIAAGHFARAHELLRQATQAQVAAAHEAEKLEQQAHEARDAQMLGAASSTAAEGDVAMTERRYPEAAELFGQAADYIPSGHPTERKGYLLRQEDALYREGDERGDNAALESAAAVCKLVMAYPRARDWPSIQLRFGNALKTLGERESGTARLEGAVAAYRAALEEWPRERVPLSWAAAQTGLGNALLKLGERESGTARLEEAVAAYRAALKEYTRERVPLDWARTQSNLGFVLWRLGQRESGTAQLEEAVAALRAALEERARKRVPLQWASTQNDLGLVLETFGERESETTRLEEAVVAYRAALEERTRERVPLDWATTENNLANALTSLGKRDGGTPRLEEAIADYRTVLEERTRERVPLDWARTQNNLGDALSALGELETGTAQLEEALGAYGLALQEWTRERVPLEWARAFGGQGVALMLIADRINDAAMAQIAVTQIETASRTLRDGGQAPRAAYYQAQLPKARAIRDRLKAR